MTDVTATAAMLLGWVGAACSMGAYWAVSNGRVTADSLRYHALNIVACALLAIACLATRAWPSMVVNVLFIVIGLRMTWRVRDRLVTRLHAQTHGLVARLRVHAPQVRIAAMMRGARARNAMPR